MSGTTGTAPTPPSFEAPLRLVVLRAADTVAFVVLALVLGALALRLLPSRAPDVLGALWLVVVVAFLAGAVPEHRRRERAARAMGVPLREWTRSAPIWRPSFSRPWGALVGLLLVQAFLSPARSASGVVIFSAGAVVAVLVLVLGRRARRHETAAARAAHPGAAVVPVVLVGLGSLRLARWAGATGVRLPDDLDARGTLVADADGLVLRSTGRRARPLLRWGWDDVELHEARRGPDAPDAAVLLLTLLAPGREGLPAGDGRRSDVTFSVRTGHGPVASGVVGPALAHLLSRRPAAVGTGPTSAGGTS